MSYRVAVRCLWLLVVVGCTQTQHVDFAPARPVVGVVRSAEGAPLAGATVTVERGASGGCIVSPQDSAVTDEQGRYTLDLPAGLLSANLAANAANRAPRSIAWTRALERVDFTLYQPVELAGVVRDARGVPVSRAVVWSPGETTVTDRDGHFTLSHVDRGRTTLTVEHGDFEQLVTEVDTDAAVALTLEDGVPLAVDWGRGPGRCSSGYVAVTQHGEGGEDGGVTVLHTPTTRPYDVEFFCHDDHDWMLRARVEPPLPRGLALHLPRLREVTVQFVDRAGQPVLGQAFMLQAVGTGGADQFSTTAVEETDLAGRVTMRLPDGEFMVRVVMGPPWVVAQRAWHGEPTLRFVIDVAPPNARESR
jgi:hypothetical protein